MWQTLGIQPTTDIKAIKSAYAKLAKQYNPEEYPEEFQKIFDAYKAACAYAKRNRPLRTSDLPSSHIPPKQERTEEIADEDELDFSGIDTSRKHPPKEEITDEDELDFSGIDTSRKRPPKEEITDEDELDFSGIDTSRKHPPKEEITDEDELDFSGI
ncbi:MAG: J domain-containing protein, partial [Oscillospiraceae bacterium]|nr:J domain-containing protein [Oscillospiraceae bacterium]